MAVRPLLSLKYWSFSICAAGHEGPTSTVLARIGGSEGVDEGCTRQTALRWLCTSPGYMVAGCIGQLGLQSKHQSPGGLNIGIYHLPDLEVGSPRSSMDRAGSPGASLLGVEMAVFPWVLTRTSLCPYLCPDALSL